MARCAILTQPMNGETLREQRWKKRSQEILEAALEVFSEKGYGSASMEEIAERALLTRVALYNYFPDKPALFKALRQWKLEELARRTDEALRAAGGFPSKVRAAAQETLKFQEENEGFFRIIFSTNTGPELGEDRSLEPYLDLLSGILEEQLGSGEGSASELAGFLATLAFKPSIKRNLLGKDEPIHPARDAELVERLFLYGVFGESGKQG